MGRFDLSDLAVKARYLASRPGLTASIARFEIGRQLRQPRYWITALLFFGFAVALISNHGFLGSPVLARNAPTELAKAVSMLSVFYLFVIVALASDAALRDGQSGFEGILRAAPVRRIEHMLGRLLGVQLAAIGGFLLACSGLLIGAAAPWIDKAAVGPFDPVQTLLIAGLVAAPTVAVLTAFCFAAAAGLRSAPVVYVLVIGLVFTVVLGVKMVPALSRAGAVTMALIEPFGVAAQIIDLVGVDPDQRAKVAVLPHGYLMLNRLVGLGVSACMAALALVFERREDAARLKRRPTRVEAAPAIADWPRARQSFGRPTQLAQLILRSRWELKRLLWRPSTLFLLGICGGLMFWSLWLANSTGGTPSLPATRVMAQDVMSWIMVLGLVVGLFYAGDTVWRDRDQGAAEMVDAAPVPDAVLMAGKIVALAALIGVIALLGVGTAILVQWLRGYSDGRPDLYWRLMIAPVLWPLIMIAAASVAVAALSPNRYVAWAVTAIYVGASIAASEFGVGHPLLSFLNTPSAHLSEMNLAGDGSHAPAWLTAYWTCWTGLLLLVAWLRWPRGKPAPRKVAWAMAGRRLKGGPSWLAGGLLASAIGLGAFIFVNTNIWNHYIPEPARERMQADYERAVAGLIGAPEPTLTAVTVKVELFPRRHALEASGTYVLENRTGAPLRAAHFYLPAEHPRLTLDGARETSRDGSVARFALDRPMAPGERRLLRFTSQVEQRGFGTDGGDTRIVDNGTFIPSYAFLPTVGMRNAGFLTDADARRRQKLPPERPALDPSDPRAPAANYVHADWADSDITVVTDADQTPVAPGRRISDRTDGDRRTARFVSNRPILGAYSIQSARYAVRKARRGGVEIEVYHHPSHGVNVNRMITALKGGLDVYEREYGPYQFDYLRIVEFPAYGDYAQAFAGTIPFSENAGFVADVRDGKHWDYVTGVTLHELAHQWWAHQVIGADAKGARLLSEGLADYSAAMAQNRLQGAAMADRGVNLARINYLKARGERREAEPSLALVEEQDYVAYQKAQLVFLNLRDSLGEKVLHRGLRDFRDQYAHRGAPYPTTYDLLRVLQARVGRADKKLIGLYLTGLPPLIATSFEYPEDMTSDGDGSRMTFQIAPPPKKP